ncbi:sex minus [Lichtheimia corymbifera JMRC:FSU:9682]|uniref:Sex minus n=1 Tax=Lichtheimia corymbifera JMRC:FSU:9682 TaxID=1263082 RepID=A0A068SEH9_9FUNG|nr:sex minus [Lichtheimia corymbifera JMRC:FSU:9682]
MYQLVFVNELAREYQAVTGSGTSPISNSNHTSTTGTITRRAPRPRNAFILYRQARRAEIRAKNCKLHSSEISKIAAQMWKHESETVRQQFARKADEEKLMHAHAYPGYKYRPQRKRKDGTTRKWHPPELKKTTCNNENAGTVHEFSDISPPSQCLDDSFLGTFLDDYTIFGLYQTDVPDH